MASDQVQAPGAAAGPFTNPWPPIAAGLAATVAAVFCSSLLYDHGSWAAVPLALVALGGLAAAAGVAVRPASPAVLGTAALASLFAGVALYSKERPDWDTLSLLFRLLAAVAGGAAVLMVLPQTARR